MSRILNANHVAGAAMLLLFSATVAVMPARAERLAAGVESFEARLVFNPQATPEKIYSGLHTQAVRACDSDGVRSLKQRQQDNACAARLLDSAVRRLNRSDVAALHGQTTSHGFETAGR